MERHYQLSDIEFEQQFANCSLDPALFSHEAHIRLAWIHVKKYEEKIAIEHICNQIQLFDQIHGNGTKFNKTVTIASVKAVHHFIGKSKAKTFKEYIEEFPRLINNFKALLDYHYGFDIFLSNKAKVEYPEPDLLPFN